MVKVTAAVAVDQTCDPGVTGKPDPSVFWPSPDQITLGKEFDGRLVPDLRALAQGKDPQKSLGQAAYNWLNSNTEKASAIADLAVTGRMAFTLFGNMIASLDPDSQDELIVAEAISAARNDNKQINANDPKLVEAARAVLDRAFSVVHALRGSPQWRANLRNQLGWITVSGEDDPPHRPVNVASAPYWRHDINVAVNYPFNDTKNRNVDTRFIVAPSEWPPGNWKLRDPRDPSSDELAANGDTLNRQTLRALPPEPWPTIPDGDMILLFIHGHMSSAEEAMALIPELRRIGNTVGVPVTVIAFDLPTMGYATRFFHQEIAPLVDESRNTPLLDFTEQFILDFVNALDAQLGNVKNRIAAVIGGSLGGHMGLRLSMRSKTDYPWLRKIAAWSPASVWDSFADGSLAKEKIALGGARNNILPLVDAAGNWLDRAGKLIKAGGEDQAMGKKDGSPTIRQGYFYATYVKGLGVDPPQPVMWYGKHWENCKTRNIAQSRLGRHEDYDPLYRQWHWRTGYEMLVYSFTDGNDPKQPKANPRYLSVTSTMLLAAGEDDNYNFANICDATKKIAPLMINAQGLTLFLANTGHSIHDEQPTILANGIFALILDEQFSPLDQDGRAFGEPCTWPEQADFKLGRQFDPTQPLKLHWVAPGLTDPRCDAPPRSSLVSFPVSIVPGGPRPS